MAADPTLSVRVSELQDPSVLFERFNTEQIRRIERRVRGDIEQKKEELRQMVGERYRDLIDAADTIGEMSRSSASLVRSITDLDRYCHSLKRVKGGGRGPEPGDPGEKTQWRCSFFRTAAQLRLLLEIPERVWSAVEACQYLTATQLYLLSVHLQAQLQLDAAAGGHYAPILARFPILVRQVSTTGHFRSTILLDSRSLLRGRAVSDQAIAEALVSIMLLEDSSPRQALADFLLARKASIHQLLNAPQHGAGVKGQVCSLVELLVTTLFQTYAVFYLPPEGGVRQGEAGLSCGMLFSILENVTSTTAAKGRRSLQEDLGTGSWFRYLPTSITEFQPALRTLAQPIQREQLRDALQQWMDTCKEDICGGVSSLLVYVKSLKGLASIRDAVWDLLSSESISQHWSSVCQRLLEHQLPVWDDFLQQLFLQRLQTITREEMEAISLSSVQLLSSALRDLESQTSSGGPRGGGGQYEVDVASFLWSESSSDLLSDAGWVSVGQRGAQRSGLAMKTQALTPCVQNFCSSLDDKMKTRLDDLQHYLPPPADSRSGTAPGATGPPSSSFDRFTDLPAVEEALREGSLACVRHILNAVRSELAAAPVPTHLTSVLFLARLCQSLGALCSNLKHCVLGKELCVAKDPSRPGKKLSKVRAAATTAAVSPAHTQWSCLEEELLSCSMEAYHMWSSALCRVLLEKFSSALRAETAGAILTTSTNWEDLEIQEEAESGSSITSRIRLPVQPSWFVQALLFQLCVEVNRVGGHALPRPTLQQLLHECLVQVLQLYEDLKEDCSQVFPMTQIRSLQMLFDLRFLHVTLSSRKDESRSSRSPLDPRFLELCDWLESFIDPFDLDVFTPPLNANLNRLTQRTSVLLGLLTGSERPAGSRSSSSSSSSTTTPQESYNILPLASSQIRFGLLPLSMSNVHKPKSTARGNAAPPPAPPPADSSGPGSAFRQLVAQDDDTAASHSLFKLSWLSGIK